MDAYLRVISNVVYGIGIYGYIYKYIYRYKCMSADRGWVGKFTYYFLPTSTPKCCDTF